IGFLYVAGLPIVILNLAIVLAIRAMRSLVPAGWLDHMPWLRARAARRDLAAGGGSCFSEFAPEAATYALGLAARWEVATLLAGHTRPTDAPWAMAVAEVCGYAVWGVLSILPIFPNRTLLPLADREGLRSAIADMRLIFPLALTPFVYLIAYGYQTVGLVGAAWWGLATLGLHFMMRRMNERGLTPSGAH